MLKTACKLLEMDCYNLQRSPTEINVPGRKNMVTAAIVIVDELSLWASLVIAVVAFEIRRLTLLSAWVER